MKANSNRNNYTLEVYEQVNELVHFSINALLALKDFDEASEEVQENSALEKIKELSKDFEKLRAQFELVYGKTRILNKPENYILDQDHHSHSASQTINFDWQFIGEILFLEKLEKLF